METKKMKSIVKQIEEAKSLMAKKRDEIRELYSELEDLLESWDSGIESIEAGVSEIQNGIDSISQFV